MPVEVANYISELVPANPLGSDSRATADNQLRLLKQVLQNQFPNLGAAAVTRTAAQLNQVGVTQTPGDNTTAPASTAFVQQAIANVNAASGALIWSVSAVTPILVAAGQGVVGAYVGGPITFTLPVSPVIGTRVAVAPANGRTDNVVLFGSNKHMGITDTTMVMDAKDPTLEFLWTGAAYGWKLI